MLLISNSFFPCIYSYFISLFFLRCVIILFLFYILELTKDSFYIFSYFWYSILLAAINCPLCVTVALSYMFRNIEWSLSFISK